MRSCRNKALELVLLFNPLEPSDGALLAHSDLNVLVTCHEVFEGRTQRAYQDTTRSTMVLAPEQPEYSLTNLAALESFVRNPFGRLTSALRWVAFLRDCVCPTVLKQMSRVIQPPAF